MPLDLLRDRGVPLERQHFTWTELVQPPISKLDADAFTRARVIAMSAIEAEAQRQSHAFGSVEPELREVLAVIRRLEHHQQTLVRGLLPPDLWPLEAALALEQTAIELGAGITCLEPDPYQAEMVRFAMLDHVDHLYRLAALYDRLYGQDADAIVQAATDLVPGRPTALAHRHPLDDLRTPYHRGRAELVTKLHARTSAAVEHHMRDLYLALGGAFADPTARQLFAEIASIEEQHGTQAESLIDPHESSLEKLLLHQATEAYNYWSCLEYEPDPRIRAIWERLLAYELGHVQAIAAAIEKFERRDVAELLGPALRVPLEHAGHRELVRAVLRREVGLGARGSELVPRAEEAERTRRYRARVSGGDVPSNTAAAGWVWRPGGELASPPPRGDGGREGSS